MCGPRHVQGLVEFFDPRQKQAAGKVSTAAGLMDANAETAGAGERGSEVTALRYNDDDPLQLVIPSPPYPRVSCVSWRWELLRV
jgi:hypothetical protein